MASKMTGRGRALLGMVIVALLGVGIGTAIQRHNSTDTTTDPAEMVKLLTRGQQQTYHAQYTAAAPAGHLDVELWREPPRFRERIDASAAGLAARTDTLVNGTQATACTQLATTQWICTKSAQVNVADADAVATATRGLAGEHVVKKSARIDGIKAICYSLNTPGAAASVLCVTPDGIPLRVTSRGFRFEIVTLQRTVDPSAFISPGG